MAVFFNIFITHFCTRKNYPVNMLINNSTYSDIWQHCLSQIREQTSQEEFVKWFKPIVPNFDGTTLQVRVPNEAYVYHIEKHYIPFLRPIIHEAFGQKTKLRYSIPNAEHHRQQHDGTCGRKVFPTVHVEAVGAHQFGNCESCCELCELGRLQPQGA